jgi:pentose-5-phosphate-3-epimerase
MGIHAGKEHQSLNTNTTKRISALKKKHKNLWVQVDGGVNAKTIGRLARAGVDAVNSGSFVSEAEKPREALKLLEERFRE